MYANVVMGVETHHFEAILTGYKKDKGYNFDTDMTAEDWQAIIGAWISLGWVGCWICMYVYVCTCDPRYYLPQSLTHKYTPTRSQVSYGCLRPHGPLRAAPPRD